MAVLIIAEKPSVGREIAAAVGARRRAEGYIEGGGYVVSWCRGHLVDLVLPDGYRQWAGKWDFEKLPMVPRKWKWEVSHEDGARGQYAVLESLMARADVSEIVCATDADREGEGIFRRIYALAGCEKPVRRLWSSSLVPEAILRDLASARPWSDYEGLGAAAEGRAKADWLVGLNATRAYVTTYHRRMSAGRVQTPTLALLVERTRAVEGFVPEPFWTVRVDLGGFVSTSGRYESAAEAEAAAATIRETGTATVMSAEYRDARESAPRLYDLTNLQRDASERLGMTADETLSTLQGLYEAKLVTYPRTDSQYITEEEESEARELLPRIADAALVGEGVASAFDMGRADVSRVVDGSKVMGHSALLPTRLLTPAAMSSLGSRGRAVALLICSRFLAAVMEPAVRAKAKVEVDVAGIPCTASATSVRDASWIAVVSAAKDALRGADTDVEADDDEVESIPYGLAEGDELAVKGTALHEGKTSPPKHYTDATLLSAMANAGRRIEDAELAAAIDDDTSHPGGLGTPATRASIIERVISAGYAVRKGKSIVATREGCELIDTVDDSLKTPELTAKWELELSRVERGEGDLAAFLRGIEKYTAEVVAAARAGYTPERGGRGSQGGKVVGKCPRCGRDVVRRGAAYQCVSLVYEKDADGRNRIVGGCGFRLFETIAGKKLTENQMTSIIAGKTVKAAGFKSKKGTKFEAKMRLNAAKDRIEFVWDE